MSTNLLTAGEVAARLRVSRATVYRWAADGTIPSVRIGDVVRFNATAIDALADADDGPSAA